MIRVPGAEGGAPTLPLGDVSFWGCFGGCFVVWRRLGVCLVSRLLLNSTCTATELLEWLVAVVSGCFGGWFSCLGVGGGVVGCRGVGSEKLYSFGLFGYSL